MSCRLWISRTLPRWPVLWHANSDRSIPALLRITVGRYLHVTTMRFWTMIYWFHIQDQLTGQCTSWAAGRGCFRRPSRCGSHDLHHDPKIRNINGDSNASRRSLLRCCKHMSHEEASIDDHRCRYSFALSWAPLCWTFCMKLETWTTEIAKYLWSLWYLLREGSWLTMKT